jgi:hypothetical protein
VPAVHVSTSLHADYHAPGDTIDKIDRRQLEGVGRSAARALVALAHLRLR